MKILLIDTSLDGHHKLYMDMIMENDKNEYLLMLPKVDSQYNIKIYNHIFSKLGKLDLIGYLKWIFQIRKIVEKENIDIVHFLYADYFYRFGGLGIGSILGKVPVIITQHIINTGYIRSLLLKRLCEKSVSTIVHTEINKDILEKKGLKNIEKISYPSIGINKSGLNANEAKEYFGINNKNIKVFVVAGGTSYYKGLDLLLESLKDIQSDFRLLIIGKVIDFSLADIEEKTKNYSNKVILVLEEVSDEIFEKAIIAADCVVLPYRKSFNGASGPLAIGVWAGKYIIGKNSESIGDIIERNRLGDTFKTEDVRDLSRCIQRFLLLEEQSLNEQYCKYQQELSSENFLEHQQRIYSAAFMK